MDINHFLVTLLHELSNLDFVEKIDLHTEVFILKGRIFLKKGRFLQIYYNESTGTTAFALIEKTKRLWGIDYDKVRGWHLHPIENPDSHYDIENISIKEIITLLSKIWDFLE